MAFDINSHLQQMGFGRSSGKNEGDPANEKDIIDGLIVGSAGKATGSITKLAGVNLSSLGEIGVQHGLESDGLAGKMITTSILPDAQGGVIAKIIQALVKNGHITDHTGGVGGAPHIEGLPTGDARFPVAEAHASDLGNFSPPSVGVGPSRSESVEIA